MWTIIEKEFLDNLLNQRLQVAILVSVLLTIGCIMLQASDYSRRLEDYRLADASQEEFLDGFKAAEVNMMSPQGLIPPKPLSPLVNGLQSSPALSFDQNYLVKMFPVLDLLFIVSVIMSLMAVLFSHDAVCGERERGTLRLITSNAVARPKLILAKWLGGSSSILLPLVISCLVGMIYISVSPRMQLGVADWLEVLLILLASLAFISVFYLLGLLVSSLVRSSAAAVLISVLVWAVFIFVIPNLGPYLATRIEPVKTADEILTRVSRGGWNRFYDNLEKQRDLNTQRYVQEYGQIFSQCLNIDHDKRELLVGEQAPDLPVKRIWQKYSKEDYEIQDNLHRAYYAKLDKLMDQARLETAKQTRLARNFSAVSPFSDYLYLATEISGTGLESREYDSRQSSAYWSQVNEYRRKISKAVENASGNTGPDLSGRPRFDYKPQPLAERLKAVLPFGAALLFFNLLFFTGAFVGFLRYDVR